MKLGYNYCKMPEEEGFHERMQLPVLLAERRLESAMVVLLDSNSDKLPVLKKANESFAIPVTSVTPQRQHSILSKKKNEIKAVAVISEA